jgi:hypothetical protein
MPIEESHVSKDLMYIKKNSSINPAVDWSIIGLELLRRIKIFFRLDKLHSIFERLFGWPVSQCQSPPLITNRFTFTAIELLLS